MIPNKAKCLASALILFAAAQSLALVSRNTSHSEAKSENRSELLVKFTSSLAKSAATFEILINAGYKVEPLTDNWVRLEAKSSKKLRFAKFNLAQDPNVEFIQPNYPIHLLETYQIQDPLRRAIFAAGIGKNSDSVPTDNPEIPSSPVGGQGADPLYEKQWGMIDIGAKEAALNVHSDPSFVIAVIDTGVDYTHEDLAPNLWRNPGETGLDAQGRNKEKNSIDDDGNGFVDDVIGWDFVSNDNKPYDLTTSWQDLLKGEGNPGHGTHCAGSIAAKGDNGIGITGVGPNLKIMALRMISEKGQGTTADAVKAIKYAVDNGAKVLSNSWGSEGEDPTDGTENQALRDVIKYSMDHGVIFVAAAGNGHSGIGYDNDTDAKPTYPASYDFANIISVAALDKKDQLGSFSNWGIKTVDIGAPGVSVFSTMVDNRYSDLILDVAGFEVPWDGTSMAAPHVSGALGLYWSTFTQSKWQEVKSALLSSAKKIPALSGKVASEGKLDVNALMKQ